MKWLLTIQSFTDNIFIERREKTYFLIVPGPDGEFGEEISKELAELLIKELGM